MFKVDNPSDVLFLFSLSFFKALIRLKQQIFCQSIPYGAFVLCTQGIFSERISEAKMGNSYIIIHMGDCDVLWICFKGMFLKTVIFFFTLQSILTPMDFFSPSSFLFFPPPPKKTWAILSVMRPLSMSYSFDSSGKVACHRPCSFCCSSCFIPGYFEASLLF